jgi:hypothetical protein
MFRRELLLVAVVISVVGCAPCAGGDKKPRASTSQPFTITPLHRALMHVESRGDPWAIGDQHLAHKAYGPLQIRQTAVTDLNRRCAKEIQDRFGKQCLKVEDFLGNVELSCWAFDRYTDLYARPKVLGRAPTDEDRARIWNGGPSGHRNPRTRAYWRKVSDALRTGR